jgi:hypothetical protein
MEHYYRRQAETGVSTGDSFAGRRYRSQSRFMGRGIFSSILPLVTRALPFLGRSLLNTAVNVAEEFKANNEADVKDVLKRSAAKSVDEGLDKVKMVAKKLIVGSGRPRGRPRKKSVTGEGNKKKKKHPAKKSVKGAGKRRSKKPGPKKRYDYTPHLF